MEEDWTPCQNGEMFRFKIQVGQEENPRKRPGQRGRMREKRRPKQKDKRDMCTREGIETPVSTSRSPYMGIIVIQNNYIIARAVNYVEYESELWKPYKTIKSVPILS